MHYDSAAWNFSTREPALAVTRRPWCDCPEWLDQPGTRKLGGSRLE